MEQEALLQVSADLYERSDQRTAHRNGYRTRTLKSTEGDLSLKKPQIREYPFETKVFEKYSRTEKAIDSVILESYLQGVSTRNVTRVVQLSD
jgi:transposase-like protein